MFMNMFLSSSDPPTLVLIGFHGQATLHELCSQYDGYESSCENQIHGFVGVRGFNRSGAE